MTLTTIKVPIAFRERVAELARERGVTQASLLEQALEELVWKFRMDQVREAMASASAEDLATYEEESRAWERLGASAIED
jgi:predicted transcriptional regulator